MPQSYLSFGEQTRHYFERPHETLRMEALNNKAAWRATDILENSDWKIRLTSDQIDECTTAIAAAKATGKEMGALEKHDFPLPTLADEVSKWRTQVDTGRGFQVITGLPVEAWGDEDTSLFFWCLGLHLGRPGAQNPQNDLLGHVTDTGAEKDQGVVRYYQTNRNIAYHCDAADIVGLLCLRKAKHGGQSRIVSSVSVYNEILRRQPDLIDRLYRPFLLDIRDNPNTSGPNRYVPITPCCFDGDTLRTFYHSDYFRSVHRHPDVPAFTTEEQTLLDLYEQIANETEFYIDMDLEPGDIQLVSNHTILHARTDYQDHANPAEKRHLLRLWLSIEG